MAFSVVITQRVAVLADSETNGGVDFFPAIVTQVAGIGDGPNGGTIINVWGFPNTSSGPTFLEGLEMMDYQSDALAVGVGISAWPGDNFQ